MNRMQIWFNKAWHGFAAQGWEPSVVFEIENTDTTSAFCRYRGKGIAKCGVGHCIPNGSYTKGFENMSVVPSRPAFVAKYNVLMNDHPELFSLLLEEMEANEELNMRDYVLSMHKHLKGDDLDRYPCFAVSPPPERPVDLFFLSMLQTSHDQAAVAGKKHRAQILKDNMERLAKTFELEIPQDIVPEMSNDEVRLSEPAN